MRAMRRVAGGLTGGPRGPGLSEGMDTNVVAADHWSVASCVPSPAVHRPRSPVALCSSECSTTGPCGSSGSRIRARPVGAAQGTLPRRMRPVTALVTGLMWSAVEAAGLGLCDECGEFGLGEHECWPGGVLGVLHGAVARHVSEDHALTTAAVAAAGLAPRRSLPGVARSSIRPVSCHSCLPTVSSSAKESSGDKATASTSLNTVS